MRKTKFQFASSSIGFLFVNTRLSKVVAMADGSSYNVNLYIYDLSKGLARQLSPMMLGEFFKWPEDVGDASRIELPCFCVDIFFVYVKSFFIYFIHGRANIPYLMAPLGNM